MIVAIVVLLLIFVAVKVLPSLGERGPEDVVEAFYLFEKEGDFGSAWELFHPSMQARFSKNAYVTERSHIYMSHFGVDTFSYELDGEEEVENFKMVKDGEVFPIAYYVEVSQTFKSKFGTFTVIQDVYAVKHEEEWKVVWNFK